jgi:serine/threonine protein kinase
VTREINRGATAVVYAADDLRVGRSVALKVGAARTHGSAGASDESVLTVHAPRPVARTQVMSSSGQVPSRVVKAEIAFSKSVRHDHVVKMLDVFVSDSGQLVIVWELVEGPDLLELVVQHGGRLPEPHAAFYYVQLVRAVQAVHDHGFTHRCAADVQCAC